MYKVAYKIRESLLIRYAIGSFDRARVGKWIRCAKHSRGRTAVTEGRVPSWGRHLRLYRIMVSTLQRAKYVKDRSASLALPRFQGRVLLRSRMIYVGYIYSRLSSFVHSLNRTARRIYSHGIVIKMLPHRYYVFSSRASFLVSSSDPRVTVM